MGEPFSFSFPQEVSNILLKSPSYISSSDGTKLAYYEFLPLSPKAIIVFYHGGGAWSNQIYQYMAEKLNKNYNIGVYLFDIRGHGNSQGPRGDAPTKEQVFRDISFAVDFVSHRNQHSPIFLGGHSSGAGLILNYNDWTDNKKVKGYLLLAPFLGPSSNTSYDHNDKSKQFVNRVQFIPLFLHILSNGFFFPNTPVIFFNYPELEKKKDSKLLGFYTNTMAQATTPSDARKLFTALKKPCCLFVGELDEQFIPEKIVGFKQFIKNIDHSSIFKILPKSTHLSVVIDAPETIAQWIDNNK